MIDLFEVSFLLLNNVLLILLTHKKAEKIVTILSDLELAEKSLKTMTKSTFNYYSRTRNSAFAIFAFKYILAIITCVLDCLDYPEYAYFNIGFQFIWSFHFSIDLVIILILMVLKQQYKNFVSFLQHYSVDFQKILKLYKHLRKIFVEVQTTFQEIVVIMMVTNFGLTVTGSYYTITSKDTPQHSEVLKFLFIYGTSALWLILMGVVNFTMLYLVDSVIVEVNDGIVVLHFNGLRFQDSATVRALNDGLKSVNKNFLPYKYVCIR